MLTMSTLLLKMKLHGSIDAAARKPRRPYHHGNLRRALLDEALATIRAEGVDGLTLREIGARLGVSRTALYRHFADKRALLDGRRHRRIPNVARAACHGVGGRWPRPRGVPGDGCRLRSFRCRQPVALSCDVRRLRRPAGRRPELAAEAAAPSRRWWTPLPRCSATPSYAATTPC